MKGKFLVLEGIDGCGKITQINQLSQWLPKSGLMPENTKLHITREPGGTKLGKSLRKMLLNTCNQTNLQPTTELLLYAADRAQHVSQLIYPALLKGDWVLSDRFSGSTLAYQGYGRKLNLKLIKQLEEIATQGLNPDIPLLLDLSVAKSISRRQEESDDRIEQEGSEFLRNVSFGFLKLAQERDWITISAESSQKAVTQKIQLEIIKKLKKISK